MNRGTWFRGMLSVALLLALAPAVARAQDFAARFERIKQEASDADLYRLLYDLPKGGDIHHHLGGSVWPEIWYRVATDPRIAHDTFYTRTKILNCPDSTEPLLYHITIASKTYQALSPARQKEYEPLAALSPEEKAKWLSDLWLDRPGKGRNEFFENIWPRLSGLGHDPYVLAEALVENMKLYRGEHVRYLETQAIAFGVPTFDFVRPDGTPMPMDEALDIFRNRLKQRDAVDTGVTVRFQAVVIRFLPTAVQGVEEAYRVMDRNRDLFVGINMAGREDNEKGFPAQFQEVFRRMRHQYSGLSISIHAGESDEPNTHIRDTLYLGARRIGHGVNLYTDPQTMLLMREDGDLVEINLISNQLLEYTPDLDKHPFPEYLRFGIPVCLNTDDRGMYGTDLTDEYFTAVRHYNLTWPEIVQMGRDSLRYSFADAATKKRLIDGYDRDVAAFAARYDTARWPQVAAQVKPLVTAYAHREFHLP